MARIIMLTPAVAQLLASCIEIGFEGAPDDALADSAATDINDIIGRLCFHSAANEAVELTIGAHEDEDEETAAEVYERTGDERLRTVM